MDFEIRMEGLENPDPRREHAELLVLAHLGRFRAELTRVSIVLGRRNGPTRPPEVRCEITATGPRPPDHRRSPRPERFPGLSLAIQRTARAVRHDLRRVRARRVD